MSGLDLRALREAVEGAVEGWVDAETHARSLNTLYKQGVGHGREEVVAQLASDEVRAAVDRAINEQVAIQFDRRQAATTAVLTAITAALRDPS